MKQNHNARPITLLGARTGMPGPRPAPRPLYVEVRYAMPVPVRGRGRAMVLCSYIGVVGVLGGKLGVGGTEGNPEVVGVSAGDGGGDADRNDVAEVDADRPDDEADRIELSVDDDTELESPPTLRTVGTGTGARSPPSTGCRG